MSKDFQNGFALGLASGGVVESEFAKASVTISPIAKATAEIEASGEVTRIIQVSLDTAGIIGNFLTADGSGYAVSKTRDGLAIAGYFTYGSLLGVILVSEESAEATYMSGVNADNVGTTTYNDATVYYNYYPDVLNGAEIGTPAMASGGVAYNLGYYSSMPSMSTLATRLLDYYYSL